MSGAFTTPDLCDEHAAEVRVLAPVLRTYGGREDFFGPAVTVRCDGDNGLVKQLVAQPGDGRVLVVDGGGAVLRALMGDQMASQAAANGWSGVLVHGAVRDVEILRTIGLGVQALASVPTPPVRDGVGEVDVPVTFGGVTFSPGDWVYADLNGVVVAGRALIG